jgi:hypothetical protein
VGKKAATSTWRGHLLPEAFQCIDGADIAQVRGPRTAIRHSKYTGMRMPG